MSNQYNVSGLKDTIQNYILLGDQYRVKDCLIQLFSVIDPSTPEACEYYEQVKEAVLWLYEKGWSAAVIEYNDDLGTQFICVSPKNEWFYSNYR